MSPPSGIMLERTGQDLGATTKIYERAEVLQFCSANYSRQMMGADPRLLAFCPFGVGIYTLPGETDTVHLVYRRMQAEGVSAGRARGAGQDRCGARRDPARTLSSPEGRSAKLLRSQAMERKKVNSSQIRSVGYEASSQTLEVEMSDGTIWQYTRVPIRGVPSPHGGAHDRQLLPRQHRRGLQPPAGQVRSAAAVSTRARPARAGDRGRIGSGRATARRG